MIFPSLNFLTQVGYLQRIPLDFLQGDKFREAADNYVRPLLTKVFMLWPVMFIGYLICIGR